MEYIPCPHCGKKLPLNSMKACDCTCPHEPKPKGAAVCDDCIQKAIEAANAERTGKEIVPGAQGTVGLTPKERRSLNVILRNTK